ncbi:MAG: tryptophan synthase subunit alpha [Actinomycetota bacterium]
MSTTERVLSSNRDSGKTTLVGYFPLGFPNLQDSIEAAVAMCENGVDVLELGIPYSDPVMDGPVIQQATEVALEAGFKLRDSFAAIKEISERVDAPLLVMTYWNPVLQYGVERFAQDLADAGAAGAITPDLIPDEANEWIVATDRHQLDRIFLSTPTSSPERVAQAAAQSRGFVYAVSTMGITGAREQLDSNAKKVVSEIRDQSPKSLTCVGIGVSTREQVEEINSYADGAIVGSAFVRAYQQGGLEALKKQVQQLANK